MSRARDLSIVLSAPSPLATDEEVASSLIPLTQDVNNALNNYLTKASASSTYVTIYSASTTFSRWTKVYSSSATLISGVDDLAISLSYTPGYETIYINGVMIARNEYLATSGSTVLLNEPVVPNDVVDIYTFSKNPFVTNTYTTAQIDAKYNNYSRWRKTFSASATSLTGVDDNNATLSYVSGFEEVYLNGILLTRTVDYTNTSASVITLGQAVVTNDIVEVISTQPYNLTTVYTKSESDAKYEKLVPFSTTAPTENIVAGDLWVDSTVVASPLVKVYNGFGWVLVSGGDSSLNPFFTSGF